MPAAVPKKKLLILIEWFTPAYKAGGPIRSCVNLCVALRDYFDIYVLTTDTDHGEAEALKEIVVNKWTTDQALGVQVYYAKKKDLTIRGLAKIAMEQEADFVYVNLLFSPHFVLYPLWLKYRGIMKGKLILCPRGTLYESALSLKWYKKKPLLQLLNWMGIQKQILFHATNQREKNAITQYFPGSRIMIADNLPATLQQGLITCTKTTGSLNCIFIARIVPIKNLLYLLRLLGQLQKNIGLTIVGPIEDEAYWIECKNAITQLPASVTVRFLGPQQNELLPGLIRQHHLLVLPTTGENFGHAIFESFLAGRPVLISDQTPWLDIREQKAGWALPLDQPEKFLATLNHLADCNQQTFDQYAQGAWTYANNFIHNPALTAQYKALFS